MASSKPQMDMTVQMNSGDDRDWPKAYLVDGRPQTSPDADRALRSDIFYGTGYEGSPALQRKSTQQDFAISQVYANRSAIVGLGFDPNVVRLKGNTKSLSKTPNVVTEGMYGPPDSSLSAGARLLRDAWGMLGGEEPPEQDTINVAVPSLSTGKDLQPDHFSPRVVAHESAHRGLEQMNAAVFGDGKKQGWVNRAVFTKTEQQALDELHTGALRGKGNEFLVRLLEKRLTGDNSSVENIMGNADVAKSYNGAMSPDDYNHYSGLLDSLETAAQKIVAQRRLSGPR